MGKHKVVYIQTPTYKVSSKRTCKGCGEQIDNISDHIECYNKLAK